MGKGSKRKRGTSSKSSSSSLVPHFKRPKHKDTGETKKLSASFPQKIHKNVSKKRLSFSNSTALQCLEKNQKQQQQDFHYQGFVRDKKSDLDRHGGIDETEITQALEFLRQKNFFRTDVTQPFGLGTKCAATYVTRCLLGEEGTTYKYLGLRLFSHPWRNLAKKVPTKNHDAGLFSALGVLERLNNTMVERTSIHRSELSKLRDNRALKGRAAYDVCLVNRMEDSDRLKPMVDLSNTSSSTLKLSSSSSQNGNGRNDDGISPPKDARCSVSWHADSCLEHYSSIAVYHILLNNKKVMHPLKRQKQQQQQQQPPNTSRRRRRWSVAMRVARDAEGPRARATRPDPTIPTLTVTLPSGSAYYLLEDFNHHHQHAVYAEDDNDNDDVDDDEFCEGDVKDTCVRYSCTHRLLREGHRVDQMAEKCRLVLNKSNNRKGRKIWLAEQKLLTELESDWLRQFFVQGVTHRDRLWWCWEQPLMELFAFWMQLEERTQRTVELLRMAAEPTETPAAFIHDNDNEQKNHLPKKTLREAKKLREKQKKAFRVVEEILARDSDANSWSDLYGSVAECLVERSSTREQWERRYADPVYRRSFVDPPLPFPVSFADDDDEEGKLGRSCCYGKSTLPSDLRPLARALVEWGCQRDRTGNGMQNCQKSSLCCSGGKDRATHDSGNLTEQIQKKNFLKNIKKKRKTTPKKINVGKNRNQ